METTISQLIEVLGILVGGGIAGTLLSGWLSRRKNHADADAVVVGSNLLVLNASLARLVDENEKLRKNVEHLEAVAKISDEVVHHLQAKIDDLENWKENIIKTMVARPGA